MWTVDWPDSGLVEAGTGQCPTLPAPIHCTIADIRHTVLASVSGTSTSVTRPGLLVTDTDCYNTYLDLDPILSCLGQLIQDLDSGRVPSGPINQVVGVKVGDFSIITLQLQYTGRKTFPLMCVIRNVNW